MEYFPNTRFDLSHALKKNTIETPYHWRCFHFSFIKLPSTIDKEKLSQRIYKIFEQLTGGFYVDIRDNITVFCKMGEMVILDDLVFKIKNLIKNDFICRLGEQMILGSGIVSIQFIFSPSSDEEQRLSQEFILQERMNRQSDIIMVVEDDLFSRNIAKNALNGKFKVIEISDGAKATQEYVTHSPDVVFLDIHLPNKKGPQILKEIMEVDPQAFVIMLSADAAKDRVMQCVDMGAKGFVAKPFKGDKLLDYIRKCPTIRVYC